MTRLLDLGIDAVRQLPADRQDAAGELLLAVAAETSYRLSPQQLTGIRDAQAQVARGELAKPDDVRAVFGNRFE